MSSAAKFFQERLRELRAGSGLTQEAVAERAGMPYKVYQHIEAGRRSNPRLSTIEKLAGAFGLSVNEFFLEKVPAGAPREGGA